MCRIASLYAIEAESRGRTPEARLAVRRAHALPIVVATEPWLRGQLETVPASPTRRAPSATRSRTGAVSRPSSRTAASNSTRTRSSARSSRRS
ncbi:MAG: transposase [Rhodospirillales bacterium]